MSITPVYIIMSAIAMHVAQGALPTLYEHYTHGGISSGLTTQNSTFKLNGKDIFIYSGAMHYFRVPKAYWRDRLKKMRTAGLNAVETYIPWNLHEYKNGTYDFGEGGSDFEDFLNIKDYMKIAQEEDLLVLVRPGPFICAEWEFGGLPSWLLREENIKVRTSDDKFMKYVERYFNILLPILAALQFTRGGPIIGFQIENEYGSVQENRKVDLAYLTKLKDIMIFNQIVELLFTSDGVATYNDVSKIPGVFMTTNFNTNFKKEFDTLRKFQPNKPLMVMELWTGWFDHWSEKHHVTSTQYYNMLLKSVMSFPASVNQYMFHGGTNWGFMNGANIVGDQRGFQPDTTSYDYDAPLSENGDYTKKYYVTKDLIDQYNPIKTKLPSPPEQIKRGALSSVKITETLPLWDVLNQMKPIPSQNLLSMENLPINNNSGQSYGYIVYRKTNLYIGRNSTLKIMGHVCDTVMVLINGFLISKPLQDSTDLNQFGYWRSKDSTINLGPLTRQNVTLDLVVENWGRVNYGALKHFRQFKGLWQGPVLINDIIISDWQIFPLEFKKVWTKSLRGWHSNETNVSNPTLHKATFYLKQKDIMDTFIDLTKWSKGITIINGFILGRHALLGPQLSLYLPAPFLKVGKNELIIFEHFKSSNKIDFVAEHIYLENIKSTTRLREF